MWVVNDRRSLRATQFVFINHHVITSAIVVAIISLLICSTFSDVLFHSAIDIFVVKS